MNAHRSRNPIRRGLQAARANVVPGIVLQVVAVSILVAYYDVPVSRVVFDTVAAWKDAYGYAFSFVSTGLFGGALPLVFARLSASTRRGSQAAWRHLPFLTVFWALKGVEIDALYRFQVAAFGDELSFRVVAMKTTFDMFFYCVIWALPTTVVAYQFKEVGYSWRGLREQFRGGVMRWFIDHVLPVLVSNWGVWLPAVVVIYCLPAALQLPIQNVILCLWGVLILWLTKAEPPEADPAAAAEDEARRAVL